MADTPAHVAQPVSAARDTLAAAGPRVRPCDASALAPTSPYLMSVLHGQPADALPAVCRLLTLRRRSRCSSWASQETPRWMPSVCGRSGRPMLTTGTRPACSSALRAMSQVCVCVHCIGAGTVATRQYPSRCCLLVACVMSCRCHERTQAALLQLDGPCADCHTLEIRGMEC